MTTFRALMLGTAAAGLAIATFAAPATAGDKIAASGNDKVKLTVKGHVNRAILVSDDGERTDTWFVDNVGSMTRYSFSGTGKISEDLSAGALIEFGVMSNRADGVEQSINTNDVNGSRTTSADFFGIRHADLNFTSKKFGKLSLGHGSDAIDGALEVDMSGTGYLTNYVDAGNMGTGLKFQVKGAKSETPAGPSVGSRTLFNDGTRDDRIRYDTPKFGGAMLSLSSRQGGSTEIAARYSGEFAGIKLAAAAGYQNYSNMASATSNSDATEANYGGSISALHSSGLNLTLAGGKAKEKGAYDPKFFYIKGGYKAKLTDLGTTAFVVDFRRSKTAGTTENVNLDAYGIGVSQTIDSAATELYAGVRISSLDDDGTTSYEDLTTALIGARVKF